MNQDKDNNIFPKWANYVPGIIFLSIGLLLGMIVFIFWYWFSPKNLNVGYEPDQPIPFSHRLHVSDVGLDCRYCHNMVDEKAHSNIPDTETCMNCHSVIKQDSEHIKKLKVSYEEDQPIEWVKVHQLPEYAYFNHSRHVNSGVSCVTCHGRVDQMDVVRQVQPLSMGWCLDCHRDPEPFLRPKDKVTELGWVSEEDQKVLGKRLKKQYHIDPKQDCMTCHR